MGWQDGTPVDTQQPAQQPAWMQGTPVKPPGQDLGPEYAAMSGFNSSIPFGNRITAGLGAGLAKVFRSEDTAGQDLGQVYDQIRSAQQETNAQHPGANLAGSLGGIVSTLPLAGAIPGATAVSDFAGAPVLAEGGNFLTKGANLGAQALKSAAVAAPVGALYGAGDAPEGQQLQGAKQGAALAGAIGGALPVAGSAISALMPKADQGLSNIAQIAQAHGIPLSLDQVSDNNVLKNVQKVSQELPFSGQEAFRQKQLSAFNKALFNTVGVDADRFTPQTMNTAFSKVGGEFDNITKGKTFDIGGDFIQNLSNTADDVASKYGSEAANIFQNQALKVIDDFKGDTIPGDLIARQRSRINTLARSASPGISDALHDLENVVVDGISSKDPEVQSALSQAKQRYKNLLVLEPVANKAKGGFINPTLLNNRVSQIYGRAATTGKAGDIGDLAKVGYELLPQLGGSDTTQKLLTAGAALGSATNPGIAATSVGATAANRLYQSAINRNQDLVRMMINNNPNALKQIMALPVGQAQQLLQNAR